MLTLETLKIRVCERLLSLGFSESYIEEKVTDEYLFNVLYERHLKTKEEQAREDFQKSINQQKRHNQAQMNQSQIKAEKTAKVFQKDAKHKDVVKKELLDRAASIRKNSNKSGPKTQEILPKTTQTT